MNHNTRILLIALVGLALLGGLIQWITGSTGGWRAFFTVALTFGILWRAGAFNKRC